MIIITAGKTYLDIDAYASMIAYRELLRAMTGEDVYAFSNAKINQTIPSMLRSLKYTLDKKPVGLETAKIIIVDVSDPEYFEDFAKEDRIVEIIDHHPGYEKYWSERPKIKSQIETIGAVCTQIYERFVKLGKTNLLDKDLCKLLVAGILDNTINLQSKNTSERDKNAYLDLINIGQLSDDFGQEYFKAREREQMVDLKSAVLSDIKIKRGNTSLLPEVIGQIILFNCDRITDDILKDIFSEYDQWMINIIALENGRSYLYCDSEETKAGLEKLFNIKSNHDKLVVLDNFILRKEILKRAIEFNQ